jgi:hypothetical protein
MMDTWTPTRTARYAGAVGVPSTCPGTGTTCLKQMHYVCFHYEFEHDPIDPDEECSAGDCPSAAVNPRPERRPETRILVRDLLREGKSPIDAIKALRSQGISTDLAKALVDSELPSDRESRPDGA